MNTNKTEVLQGVELLTRKEAADFLRCSVSHIDNCAKDLPRIRYGRKVLFSKATLQRWLLAHEDKPVELN